MRVSKFGIIAMLLVITVSSVACSKAKEPTEPVEIHLQFPFTESMRNDNNQLEPYTDAIEQFHEIHPLTTVILDYLPESVVKQITVNGEAMTQILFTSEDIIKLLKSNETSDIVSIPPGIIPMAEKEGLLLIYCGYPMNKKSILIKRFLI